MTEKKFLRFMEKGWSKGRIFQVSGRIDSIDPGVKEDGKSAFSERSPKYNQRDHTNDLCSPGCEVCLKHS